MICKESDSGMRNKSVLTLALIVSVLLNVVIGLFWFVGVPSRSEKSVSEELTDAVVYNATVTYSEIESFFASVFLEGKPEDGLYVLVPPFSCPKCVASSLPQLALTGASCALLVKEGRDDEEMLLAEFSPESIWQFSAFNDENAACYYPDLIFVIIKDGRIADYYLHNAHAPEAMAIFLQKITGE